MNIGHTHMMAAAGAGVAIIDLPNLEWFPDATFSFTDAGTTPAVDGDDVYQVNDLGPNSLHLLQTTSANRPTYETDNGFGVIRFNGTTDLMTAGDILDGVLAGPDKKWSLSISIDNFSIVGSTIRLFLKYANLSGQREAFLSLYDGVLEFVYTLANASASRAITASSSITAAKHVITLVYDGSIDTGDGLDRVSFRVDGVPIASYLKSTLGSLFDIPDTTASVTCGGWYGTVPATSPNFGAAYDWSQMVVLSNPTASDLAVVENELMARVGL